MEISYSKRIRVFEELIFLLYNKKHIMKVVEMVSVKVAKKEELNIYISECAKWGKEIILKDNMYILYSKVDGVIYGIGIVSLQDNYAVINDIIFNPNNEFSMLDFLLGTSILNFVERRGIYIAYCFNKRLEMLLKQLKFKPSDIEKLPDELKSNENIYSVNLDGYFNCNCGNK
jgi:hypothetical protein